MKNWKIELKIEAKTLAEAIKKVEEFDLLSVEEDEDNQFSSKVGF